MLTFQFHQQTFRTLPLQTEIATRRTTAADDRQLAFLRIRARLVLTDEHQRADYYVRTVVGDELGRHRLQRAGKEQVEEQRLDEVVRVVAERDLRRAFFFRDPVEHAAPQPRAQRARRRPLVEDVVDRFADAGVLDPVRPAARLARAGDQLVLVLLVAGVDVDGDERKTDRRALPQHV